MATSPTNQRKSGSYGIGEKAENLVQVDLHHQHPQYPQYSHVAPSSPPPPGLSPLPSVVYEPPDAKRPTGELEGIIIGDGQYNNSRRYRRARWRTAWDSAVAIGVWPRIIYSAIGLTLIIIWVILMFVFTDGDNKWAKAQLDNLENQAFTMQDHNGETGVGGFGSQLVVGLMGSLKQFDPAAHKLYIEWSGFVKNVSVPDPSPEPFNLSHSWNYDLGPLVIYQDVSTVLHHLPNTSRWTYYTGAEDGSPSFETQYVYKLDNSSAPAIGHIGMNDWDSVSTEISFGPKNSGGGSTRQPLLGYPFDEWAGTVTFVAIDPWYEKNAFEVNGTGIFPLAGATLADTMLNWRFELHPIRHCELSRLQRDVEAGTLPTDPDSLAFYPYPCDLQLLITGRRPSLVQFAAIIAVSVNWISTLFIFILTCEVIVMKREYMLSGTDLLGVTITALFALPTVRSLLPGAPEFGALNLVGIIPNIIIISLCVTAITIAKLRRKRRPGDKDD